MRLPKLSNGAKTEFQLSGSSAMVAPATAIAGCAFADVTTTKLKPPAKPRLRASSNIRILVMSTIIVLVP